MNDQFLNLMNRFAEMLPAESRYDLGTIDSVEVESDSDMTRYIVSAEVEYPEKYSNRAKLGYIKVYLDEVSGDEEFVTVEGSPFSFDTEQTFEPPYDEDEIMRALIRAADKAIELGGNDSPMDECETIADRLIQEVLKGKTVESVTTNYFYYPPVTQAKRRRKKTKVSSLVGRGTQESKTMKRISLVEVVKQRGPVREQENPEDYSKYLIDGSYGIYIAQEFARRYDPEQWGMDQETWDILLDGPDNELYDDAWLDLLQDAEFTEPQTGLTWYLVGGDGLWAVRTDTPEELIPDQF